MIRFIFIDIDNTLLNFDTFVQETMEAGFREFGLKPYTPDMFETFTRVNRRYWDRLEKGELCFEDIESRRWGGVFRELGVDFDGQVFEAYFRKRIFDNAIPEEGAMELVKRLSKDHLLATASNGPYLQQLNRIKVAGMAPYFRYMFISEDLGAQKPSEVFFDEAFRRMRADGLSLKPEECLIIGDSLSSDMAGGMRYGIRTLWYNRSGAPVPASQVPELTVRRLSEIPDRFSFS